MDDEKERGRHCTVRRKVKIPLQWASSKPEVIAGSWELSAAVSVDTENCLSSTQPKGSIYMYRLQIPKASSVFSWQKKRLKNTAKEENQLCFFQACPLNTERAQKRKNQVRYLDMHCFVCIAHISEKHAIGHTPAVNSTLQLRVWMEMKAVLVKALLWAMCLTDTYVLIWTRHVWCSYYMFHSNSTLRTDFTWKMGYFT